MSQQPRGSLKCMVGEYAIGHAHYHPPPHHTNFTTAAKEILGDSLWTCLHPQMGVVRPMTYDNSVYHGGELLFQTNPLYLDNEHSSSDPPVITKTE